MPDPLDHKELTGTISTLRHVVVRYRTGHESDLATCERTECVDGIAEMVRAEVGR